ncbi:MAG: thioredoxin domain-containing protein [Armatimonadetes bacterium]|nr:thioredoxin domain-containing protein [Armatimonadota bacterium]MDE2207833.1 thioredoxin domain-containing protein [Armatimonadota bacterium]
MGNPAGNRLSSETSPYLLQHASNPVDWYPWGDAAFERARSENRPILLSVGYSACHWCHVMERESFEDANIAALMNRLFVCIKVDREERPDVDSLYMAAVQAMTGQGGWPMTVFLTPDGAPFFGGTYYPPEDRYGHPGFIRILNAVAEAWESRRDQVTEQAEALGSALSELVAPLPDGEADMPGPGALDDAIAALTPLYDETYGGFGTAPKFPQAPTLDLLVRMAPRSERSASMLAQTLEAMASGGIYDHVGGGFHRYSTDRQWLVPHFEKMLYDNAQLALVYARAGIALNRDDFLAVAEETLDYLLREMCSPEGAFYSAQDADSDGIEGQFTVWSLDQAAAALSAEELQATCAAYTLTSQGNWEGKNILTARTPDARATSQELLGKLRLARAGRVPPATDDKALASWNGLALAAFAECACLCRREDYLTAALRTGHFLVEKMAWRDDTGGLRLRHTWRGGIAKVNGFLEDYACVARGFLALYEATGQSPWLALADELGATTLARFADPAGNLLYDTSDDAPALLHRPATRDDNAVPSGSAVAIEVLLRLAAIHDDDRLMSAARRLLAPHFASGSQHAYGQGRLLCALDDAMGEMTTVVLCGAENDTSASALRQVACRFAPQPRVLVSALHGEPALPGIALLDGRGPLDGRAAAYVCIGRVCRLPVSDPEELRKQLVRLSGRAGLRTYDH